MSHLVLRLLLCLLLVLNGTGYASAATQMSLAHIAMQAHADHRAPPCHDAAPHDEVASSLHAHADEDCAMSGSSAATPDCCQSSRCNCDCLQHATPALAIVSISPGPPPGGALAPLRKVDRVSPLLPHLLRPPIA